MEEKGRGRRRRGRGEAEELGEKEEREEGKEKGLGKEDGEGGWREGGEKWGHEEMDPFMSFFGYKINFFQFFQCSSFNRMVLKIF